jgi:hypothetical protein
MPTPYSLEDLLRWTDSGGLWELVSMHDDRVVLDLVTCTGGEVAGRVDSTDEALLAYVARDR